MEVWNQVKESQTKVHCQSFGATTTLDFLQMVAFSNFSSFRRSQGLGESLWNQACYKS